MKILHLARKYKHKEILVDDDDFDYLTQFNWLHRSGYAYRWNEGKMIAMHREIKQTQQGKYLDHINGNKLDNRKVNLRVATYQQNLWNKPKQANNTSGFKGVSLNRSNNTWRVRITVKGVCLELGAFKSLSEADRVYQDKAKSLQGRFAWRGE